MACSLASLLSRFTYKILSYSTTTTYEAGIFTHPLQRWKLGLSTGNMDGWVVLGHHGCGVPTFPFPANPTPEPPHAMIINPAWAFALPASEITFMVKCSSGWCYFGFTCCSSWPVLFLADLYFPLCK